MNIRKQAVFKAREGGGSGGPEDARSRRSVALRLLLRRAAKVVDGHLSFTNKKHHLRLRKDSSLRLGGPPHPASGLSKKETKQCECRQ